MLFGALFDHELGTARSYLTDERSALKLARDWIRDGEKGVRIQNEDETEEWTVEALSTIVR